MSKELSIVLQDLRNYCEHHGIYISLYNIGNKDGIRPLIAITNTLLWVEVENNSINIVGGSKCVTSLSDPKYREKILAYFRKKLRQKRCITN